MLMNNRRIKRQQLILPYRALIELLVVCLLLCLVSLNQLALDIGQLFRGGGRNGPIWITYSVVTAIPALLFTLALFAAIGYFGVELGKARARMRPILNIAAQMPPHVPMCCPPPLLARASSSGATQSGNNGDRASTSASAPRQSSYGTFPTAAERDNDQEVEGLAPPGSDLEAATDDAGGPSATEVQAQEAESAGRCVLCLEDWLGEEELCDKQGIYQLSQCLVGQLKNPLTIIICTYQGWISSRL